VSWQLQTLAMWTSDRSQINVTYNDANGAISAVNWNVIAGYHGFGNGPPAQPAKA
jgi:hypothetical protein